MRALHSHHTLPAASHCVCVCVCAPLRQVALISASCARLPLALGHKVFKVLGTRSLAQGLSGLWHKVFKVFGKVFGGEGFLPQPAHTLLGLQSLQGEEWAACTRVPYIGSLVSTPTPAVGGSAGGASGYAPRRVLDRSALALREARLKRGLRDRRPLQRGFPHGALPVHAAARAPPRPRPRRRLYRTTATNAARVPRRRPSAQSCAHLRAN